MWVENGRTDGVSGVPLGCVMSGFSTRQSQKIERRGVRISFRYVLSGFIRVFSDASGRRLGEVIFEVATCYETLFPRWLLATKTKAFFILYT